MVSVTTTGAVIPPRVVFFVTPDGELGYAKRFGRRYLGLDRWRGWELFGVFNRRAGAQLVAGRDRIRVKVQPCQPA